MRKALLQIMSDYCWLTRADIHKLIEFYLKKNISKNVLSVVLWDMFQRGELVRHPISETNDKFYWRLKNANDNI